MKSLNSILLVTTVVASFALLSPAKADDNLTLSPKGRQMRDSLRRSENEANDMVDRSVTGYSPRAAALMASLQRSGSPDKDAVDRNRIAGNERARAYVPSPASTWDESVSLAPSK